MVASVVNPQPIQPGFRLLDGTALNGLLAHPVWSSGDGITATASGTQATSIALTQRISRVATVVTAADGVRLFNAIPGKFQIIINDSANAIQVFGSGTDTINDVATATGVAQAGNSTVMYVCPTGGPGGKWYSIGSGATGAGAFTTLSLSGSLTFTSAASGPILKQGANGRVGTFVANGATPVTITNTSVAISDSIVISLNTVGGTVGVQPHVATITAGTGFTVVCTAADTSTYNYTLLKNAA